MKRGLLTTLGPGDGSSMIACSIDDIGRGGMYPWRLTISDPSPAKTTVAGQP
jgi:hypothetical protein